MVAPSGARTSTTYDAAGQVTAVTAPDGSTTTTTYDRAGRVKTVTDADGRAITNTYDAAGRQVLLTRADGSAMAWGYDAAGQLTTAADADGQVTTYGYDAAGNLTSRSTTLGTTTLTYDGAGNLTSQTAPDGTVTTYTSDAADRVTGIDYPESTPDVTYAYDSAGRLTSTTDGTGTSTRAYDAAGRLTSETRAGSLVSYEWDADGNLVALTYPDGIRTTSTYDAAGQLDEVTDPQAGTFDYDWAPDGQVAQVTYPNGVTTALEHDGQGRLTESSTVDQGGATLLDLAYSYTDAGLLAEQTITRDQTTVASQYGWDARGALDEVSGNLAGDIALTPGGQVTALEDGTTLFYAPTGVLASTTQGAVTTTYTYDARGNRTTRTVPTPDVDGAGSMATASEPSGGETGPVAPAADGTTTEALPTGEPSPDPTSTSVVPETAAPEPTDDPAGEPGAEPTAGEPTSEDPSAGDTGLDEPASQIGADVFGWDAANRLTTATVDGTEYAYGYFADGLRATAATGEQQTSFVWATAAAVPRLLTDDAHRYLYGPSSTPIAQIDDGGTVHYLHADLTGNIRAVTDEGGAVVAASDYSAYGIEHAVRDAAVSEVTAFGYAGEYADATGLIYLRARYYDPATAQFLSVDALIDLTQAPYGYANGNPLQFVDPLGLTWWNPLSWTGDTYDVIAMSASAVSLAASLVAYGSLATVVGAPVAAVAASVAGVAEGVAVVASAGGVIQHLRAGETADAVISATGVVPGVGMVSRAVYEARFAGRAAQYGMRTAGTAWRQVAQGVEAGTLWGSGMGQWLQNVTEWTGLASACGVR